MFKNEMHYRQVLQATLETIESAFEVIDPDLAGCDQAHGALTITLANGARCILSAQPSVSQLWLALASQGVAFHFNYDFASQTWLDDKGKGIEILNYLKTYLSQVIGKEIQWQK